MGAPANAIQAMPKATSPSSGGKGGANQPLQVGAPASTAATVMNAPVSPNVMGQAAQAQTAATVGTGAGMMYQPMSVEAGDVAAGQLANTNLSAYTNPYESQVVQQTMSDLDRARQIQQMEQGAKMTAAGAFGGSRHGIAQAESNRAFYDRAGALAGQMRQQGFQNAQQMAQQDLQRRMQADLANQSTQLAAATANQQMDLAGQQQRLQAASQLGRLGQQGFDMGRTIQSDIAKQGALQQLMEQQLIDAGKQQFAGYTGAPASSIGYLSQALGASTIPQSQQTRRDVGLFDYLTLAASM